MATLREKIAAEITIRRLLDEEGVPAPDWIEYGYTCIRLFWQESKVCLVVDLDEFEDDPAGRNFNVDVFPKDL
jgi:hypothetical protein